MKRILLTIVLCLTMLMGGWAQNVSLTATGGITGGTYNTLKEAFDSINTGYHLGDIEITITGNVSEGTGIAKLDSSGRIQAWGATSFYTSLLIKPIGGSWTISGNPAAGNPLIDLNGADNVTIDGLNNGTDSLKVVNNTTSTTSGTATIRLINDATFNTLTNLKVLTSNTSSTITTNGGAVFISTAVSGGNGNDNNTISNCYFSNKPSASSSFPYKLIFVNGTTTNANIANDNILITNNQFVNFRAAGVALNTGTKDITISNNHFYHDTIMPSSGLAFTPIYVSNTTANIGEGYNISGNYIGGSEPFCGGAQAKILLSVQYQVIYLGCDTTGISYVNGNTISNISIQTSYNSTETGLIFIKSGQVDIGSQQGNVIGSVIDTSDVIILHNSTSGGNYMFISIGGNAPGVFGTIRIENNLFGGITLRSLNTHTPSVRGFDNAGTTGTFILRNNSFGISGMANSIQVYGTKGNAFGFISRNGNPNINELVGNYFGNWTTYSSTTTDGKLTAILLNSTKYRVDSNTIENLVAYTATTHAVDPQVAGIVIPSVYGCVGNTVRNLFSANPTSRARIIGLDVTGSATSAGSIVAGNRIKTLYALSSDTAIIMGIRLHGNASANYIVHNNEVSLGKDSSGADIIAGYPLTGIACMSGSVSLFYNSVLLTGVNVAPTTNTFAMFDSTVSTTDWRNNVFANERSFASAGSKFNYSAFYFDAVSSGAIAGVTADYNLYTANGIGAMLIGAGGVDFPDLATWKATATSHDANSQTGNPDFVSYNMLQGSFSSAIFAGDITTGVTVDIFNNPRSMNLVGAYDWSYALPVSFLYMNATVAKGDVTIHWATASESNNKGFEVQRSTDGKQFESIGFVHGKNNSAVTVKYALLDQNAFATTKANTLYYRLKQIDNDGKESCSKMLSVSQQNKVDKQVISAFPNPFTQTLTIAVSSSEITKTNLTIVNLAGEEVYHKSFSMETGINHFTIDEAVNLKKGVYVLKVETNGITSTQKLVKQ